ncbi:MAG: hypothetical protein IPG10_12605 [Flavobacteriales bacterium]|jgi:hypothetical protein|nr:hypothetical protein [Flavobacteriales bacterium]MBK6753968.1 hypothetical protein [Flavobacteriales bacterium]MBK7751775.1 hypothetical protein [Flavobacteriales bacterium]MBK9076512.1 hypothetical protein [Flavobacteriales bacterium]MBK9539569.1 hypothetical protein [Flavobacteriales bacterium]
MPEEMKRTLLLTGVGIVLGAVAGWFYWSQFGCTTGCSITSSPVNSTLYGAFMGGLFLNSFTKPAKSPSPPEGNNCGTNSTP